MCARRAAMIEHGIELLKARDIDEVTVAEITGALGYSTGSFYSAFADKTAFFVAVQQAVNDHQSLLIVAEIEQPEIAAATLEARLALCIDFTLRYFRDYRGVLRSALRYEAKVPEAWAPNRVSAQRIVDGLVVGLTPEAERRMRVAIQLVFGALVNAVLHDPGPLRLHDEAIGPSLKAALSPYLADLARENALRPIRE